MSRVSGRVMTVLGTKDPQTLGITLTHEHLFIDFTVMFQDPQDPEGRRMARSPITLQNLGWINYNPFRHLENLSLNDETAVVEEVQHFKDAGGRTIVDCTINGIAPNPLALRKVSQQTGVNIIASTGFYVYPTHSKEMDFWSVEELKGMMVRDIENGIGETGIRAGFIKIGNTYPWHENEKKVCKAAVKAQLETGVPLSIHPGRNRQAPTEILNLLKDEGAQLDRVVMCHNDRTIDTIDEYNAVAKFQCYIELDLFGYETNYPLSDFLMPNDAGRIKLLKSLIDEGYLDRLLVSHDICWKTKWKRYGGYGFEHIPKNIVPRLRKQGFSERDIEKILVDNPRNLLTIE